MSQAPANPPRKAYGFNAGRTDLADLANAVLHEFNNALNSISLNLAVMEQKGISAQLQPEVSAIRREVALIGMKSQRLQEMCQAAQPPLEPVEINRLVQKVVQTWRDRHDSLDLRLACAPHLPRVSATPADLERVLELLLEHAAVTLKASTGRIIVSTADAGMEVELRVTDSGPPLPLEMQARMFELFAPGPTGDNDLRLPLCNALVKRLQGSIRAENQPDGGTAVIVRLQTAT